MLLGILVLVPLVMAGIALVVPSDVWRPWLLPLAAAMHSGLVGLAIFSPDFAGTTISLGRWFELDALGKLFLAYLSTLFLVCMLYAPGYLALRRERSNRVFCANLLAALSTMTLMILSQHLGLMWVAMEATTLATAPLLYFNHNPKSLEATWKYLLIGSVGIALALLGTFFLAYSAVRVGLESSLFFSDLVLDADKLSPSWLRAAFILLFVGYGTKMGLAPMHTWKPDAYGEAPGLVGALLAGGVTACAFLAILRVYQICSLSSVGDSARSMMWVIGLLSMAVAAVFMVRQRDFKRMLAYSSVEHMGILVLGVALGGAGVYGALLHLINNGLTKSVLFLSAGNIHRAYGSKSTDNVRGAMDILPLSGTLFLAGWLAITGSPPFGPFLSEFTIVNAAFGTGQYLTAGLFLALLAAIFIGMGTTVLAVVQGLPPKLSGSAKFRDGMRTGLPIIIAMAIVLVLGLYIPQPLDKIIREAVAMLEAEK
jgi:hydrogenase-4 component F